jgi:hypothetical protein
MPKALGSLKKTKEKNKFPIGRDRKNSKEEANQSNTETLQQQTLHLLAHVGYVGHMS